MYQCGLSKVLKKITHGLECELQGSVSQLHAFASNLHPYSLCVHFFLINPLSALLLNVNGGIFKFYVNLGGANIIQNEISSTDTRTLPVSYVSSCYLQPLTTVTYLFSFRRPIIYYSFSKTLRPTTSASRDAQVFKKSSMGWNMGSRGLSHSCLYLRTPRPVFLLCNQPKTDYSDSSYGRSRI